MKEKYYLKGNWEKEYGEVSKKQFAEAERNAGFYPKGGGLVATAGFFSGSVQGKVEFILEEGGRRCLK